jgi:hypothetical protein
MNAIRHLKTITKHHNLVMGFCFRAGLYRQGLFHDFSKLEPTEFWVGAKYYQGNRSPNNAERESTGVSQAWLHHKGRNRHHYEYWIDYTTDPDSPYGLAGVQMPRKYVAEMIFDRVAASMVYRGAEYRKEDPLKYFLRNRDRCWYIHPETKRQMEMLLRMWAEKGPDAAVSYIRDVFLKEE